MSNKYNTNPIDPAPLSLYPNLKIKLGEGENFINRKQYQGWTKNNILDGLRKFYDDNKRYPTAIEIDAYDYLPTSRSIQRSFGGLIKLRTELGLKDVNFAAGEHRSQSARLIAKRGSSAEREMEK